jgi:hypothetical protein
MSENLLRHLTRHVSGLQAGAVTKRQCRSSIVTFRAIAKITTPVNRDHGFQGYSIWVLIAKLG